MMGVTRGVTSVTMWQLGGVTSVTSVRGVTR